MAIDLSKPMSLHQQGRYAEATSLYDSALKREPKNPDALYLTGLCRLQMGDMERGARHMRALIKLQPHHAAAQHALGKALIEMGEPGVGQSHLKQALAINPASSDSRIELAELALTAGDAQQAKKLYRDGLNLDPSQAALWNNLGIVCRLLGQLEEAEQAWVKTISLAPSIVEAYCNIATLKVRVGQFSEGVSYLQTGLDRMPDDPELNFYHGELLFFAGKYEDSAEALKKASSLRKDFRNAEIRLAQASQYLCDWDGLESLMPAIRNEIDNAVTGKPCLVSPFFALTLPTTGAEQKAVARAETEKWDTNIAPQRQGLNFSYTQTDKERLHIGYLSADWRDHPMAHQTCGLFRHHDRSRFEVTALSYGPDDDSEYLHRIRDGAEHFVNLQALDDRSAAQKINELGIDILLDGQGFMGNSRPGIVLMRPAPIQISFLNYLGSMATPALDYMLVDHVMVPADGRDDYTEALIYAPHCYQVNDDEAPHRDPPTRADEGLPDDAMVYCALHGGQKITRDVFAAWMRILKQVSYSVLWLAGGPPLQSRFRSAAQDAGIDETRLIFARRVPEKADHVARLALADLYLDTPLYGACSSAVDCLWVGLPILTNPGKMFSSRGSATLLSTMGVTDLIVDSDEAYEQTAIALGHDPEALQKLRDKIVNARGYLFNTARWVRDMERAYEEIWGRHRNGKPSTDISV
jgi:protein O-GlcNAc transferase